MFGPAEGSTLCASVTGGMPGSGLSTGGGGGADSLGRLDIGWLDDMPGMESLGVLEQAAARNTTAARMSGVRTITSGGRWR